MSRLADELRDQIQMTVDALVDMGELPYRSDRPIMQAERDMLAFVRRHVQHIESALMLSGSVCRLRDVQSWTDLRHEFLYHLDRLPKESVHNDRSR